MRGLRITIICKGGTRGGLRERTRSGLSPGKHKTHYVAILGGVPPLTQSSDQFVVRFQSKGQASREYRYHRPSIRQQQLGLSVRLVLGALRTVPIYNYQPSNFRDRQGKR